MKRFAIVFFVIILFLFLFLFLITSCVTNNFQKDLHSFDILKDNLENEYDSINKIYIEYIAGVLALQIYSEEVVTNEQAFDIFSKSKPFWYNADVRNKLTEVYMSNKPTVGIYIITDDNKEDFGDYYFETEYMSYSEINPGIVQSYKEWYLFDYRHFEKEFVGE